MIALIYKYKAINKITPPKIAGATVVETIGIHNKQIKARKGLFRC